MKIGPLFRIRHFLSFENIICIYKATIRPCLEYCCYLWSGAAAHCLYFLNQIQNCLVNLVGSDIYTILHLIFNLIYTNFFNFFFKTFHFDQLLLYISSALSVLLRSADLVDHWIVFLSSSTQSKDNFER